ncbi:biotin--[acetyl-CoA-carboxylase] ligase [Arachidicoccus soli]|uniref:Biotin--[acetyl-CoA-carboxylase] ligase n=1 Tax=Arachidicoccus soli TaxID=2341117 RepID=A0A386HLD1_9BACT|nr:biotin--[acetyl-CoA-carboxylase] ligase [Arachidicoccus soli]AYD46585.1 biotin--[acetyl-CoA-carboxylase] ligase [Arachidicoccus soli]
MIGFPFTILDEVDSSNNYAIGLAIQGMAQHGAAFMAKHQTAGKGQRGKQWNSEAGKNIAISVLLDTSEMHLNEQFNLSMAVALSVFDFYLKYAFDETSIKWPNDIYWRDRKAVGILIENKIYGQKWQWAVAGVGINVNQTIFDENLSKKAVSLKQITGKEFDCVALAKEFCTFLEKRFQQFKEKKYNELLVAYNENLFRKGDFAQLKYRDVVYDCRIQKVDKYGQLWVEGAPKPFFVFGEVEWVI